MTDSIYLEKLRKVTLNLSQHSKRFGEELNWALPENHQAMDHYHYIKLLGLIFCFCNACMFVCFYVLVCAHVCVCVCVKNKHLC
jgi:hypothetical protein